MAVSQPTFKKLCEKHSLTCQRSCVLRLTQLPSKYHIVVHIYMQYMCNIMNNGDASHRSISKLVGWSCVHHNSDRTDYTAFPNVLSIWVGKTSHKAYLYAPAKTSFNWKSEFQLFYRCMKWQLNFVDETDSSNSQNSEYAGKLRIHLFFQLTLILCFDCTDNGEKRQKGEKDWWGPRTRQVIICSSCKSFISRSDRSDSCFCNHLLSHSNLHYHFNCLS